MTTQSIPAGIVFPFPYPTLVAALSFSAAASLATNSGGTNGDRYSMAGTFVHKAGPGTTKNIHKIHFMCGANSATANSTIKTGVQLARTGTTGPHQADGTYLASGNAFGTAVLNTLTASAWNTITLGSDPAVVVGTDIGIMWEFSAWTTPDTFILQALGENALLHSAVFARDPHTGTFAGLSQYANVILECDDGSFGTLAGSFPCISATSINSNTTPTNRQVGIAFNVPFPMRIYGAWELMNQAASSTGTMSLYTDPYGTPAIPNGGNGSAMTYTFDVARSMGSTNVRLRYEWFPDYYDLSPNTDLVMAVDSSSANNLTHNYITVNAAAHMDCLAGQNQCFVLRNGTTGVFTKTTTRFPIMGILIGGVSDGIGLVSIGNAG